MHFSEKFVYNYVFCLGLQCVGEDIEDIEYTPKPEYEGYFKVTNVKDEVKSLIWFGHMYG